MSENIRAKVEFATPIHNATDESSSRYALGNVQIVPTKEDGKVFAVATDGRILSVVPSKGHADKPYLVPRAVLARRKKDLPKAGNPTAVLNGEWESTGGQKHAEIEGRFPRVGDILPSLPDREHRLEISLDANLLLRLAESLKPLQAVGKDEVRPVVTLIIDTSADRHDSLPVVGHNGIGVIMTVAVDRSRDVQYKATREQFAASEAAHLKGLRGYTNEIEPVKE